MTTASGRDEEDEANDSLSSVWARGQEEPTPHADRAGTDDKTDDSARSGSKNTHQQSESDYGSHFCVAIEGQDEDVFLLLEADLEIQEQAGKPVAIKLA